MELSLATPQFACACKPRERQMIWDRHLLSLLGALLNLISRHFDGSTLSQSSSLQGHREIWYTRDIKINMINAVLVFNNAGQPRLTKFYTQLVLSHHFSPFLEANHNAGNICPAAFDLGNLRSSLSPPLRILQLPPSPAPPRFPINLPFLLRTPQRRALPRHIPALRNPLLYHHLHLYRIASCPYRSDTGICGSIGQAV